MNYNILQNESKKEIYYLVSKARLFLFFLGLLSVSSLKAQVGINTTTPNSLAELDIENLENGSDTIPKGIMIARIIEKQRHTIDVKDLSEANDI